MAKLYEFPSHNARTWTEIARTIRDRLTAEGAPERLQEEVLRRLKQYYDCADLELEIRFDMPEGLDEVQCESVADSVKTLVQKIESRLHEYTSNLLLERLKLEIEIYQWRNQE